MSGIAQYLYMYIVLLHGYTDITKYIHNLSTSNLFNWLSISKDDKLVYAIIYAHGSSSTFYAKWIAFIGFLQFHNLALFQSVGQAIQSFIEKLYMQPRVEQSIVWEIKWLEPTTRNIAFLLE